MKHYARSVEETVKNLGTSAEKGLTEQEVRARLEKYGKNEIKEEKPVSAFQMFINQFRSFIVIILVIAVIISVVIVHYLDAAVIAVILVINAVLGFVQEYKAEKSIEALKKMASLRAVVIRNGKEQKIDAKELVPGDVIVLETGEKIPADARLIKIVNLETQEAALTGESVPEPKEQAVLPETTVVADRKNMVFSGTIITRGRGLAVVTETGMSTEIGKIAGMIQKEKAKLTPLQIKLKKLGEILGLAAIVISALVFFVGVGVGEPVTEMFITAISVAVAAIPEGLPAVVTIALALGIQKMIKKNALIRKLPSVETLGSTTVICTDKTGTLTHNEMTVRKIYSNNQIINITGSGYSTSGIFSIKEKKIEPKQVELLLRIGALCNDAKLTGEKIIGDPTEGALIVSAAKAGIIKDELEEKYPRLAELEFTSERKRMTTQHSINNKKVIYTKGAPDVIIELCDRIYINGKVERMTRMQKKKILEMNELFAKHALRVLGFAYKESEKIEEKEMVFVGLQGMIDPPRQEAKEAIQRCNTAGIKVVMITGDYKSTAEAIGRELGLKGRAIDGQELDKIHGLEEHIEEISIFARIDPKHKVKIVDALKTRGHIVAMTGDGVNDAPALKKADIGISMGITGTDVAKEASDMILTDDNFASIVNAVEEGRGIYDNIKKFVRYLISSNIGEILTLFIGLIIGLPLPITALQILWINLVTDGLPALALGVDPKDPDIMNKPPRSPKENIINKSRGIRIVLVGLIMMLGTLTLFRIYNPEINLVYAQTVSFSVLMMFQMFNVLNCRSEEHSLLRIGIFSNMKLLGAVGISIFLQILVVYLPFFNKIFNTIPLKGADWLYIFTVAFVVLLFDEVYKFFTRRYASKPEPKQAQPEKIGVRSLGI